MEWVSGFNRNEEGRLWIERQDQRGVKALVPPGLFRSDLSIEGERCLRVRIRLREGKSVETADFLNAISAPYLEARGQKTYVFTDQKYSVVIPAQVLVFETIATLSAIKQLLLTPSSPRQAITVFTYNDETIAIQPVSSVQQKLAGSQVERLAWIQKYPSTEAFWSSIYLGALKGKLSPRLPKASLNARMRGKLVGSTLYVTRIVAAQLVAEEPPHGFVCPAKTSGIIL